MATKKTTRSPKSAPPAAPAAETKTAKSAKSARKNPAKAPQAASAGRSAAPRKRPAAAPKAAQSIPAPAVITDDDIRVRAYFLSLEYGASNGGDIDFWLLAERELRGAKTGGDQ